MLVLAPHNYPWLERLLPARLLLMASHVFTDGQNVVLDRLTGARHDAEARLRELADRVVRQPDPTTTV
jgi:hypothetical protein